MKEPEDKVKPFPIQAATVVLRPDGYPRGIVHNRQSTIPMWLAEIAYKEYVRRWGYYQTLERLAERGGFSRTELLSLLRGEDPRDAKENIG